MACYVLLALPALCYGQITSPPVSWRQFGYDAGHAGRPPYFAPISQVTALWTASFSLGEWDFSPVLSTETQSFILPASNGILSLNSLTGLTQGSSTNYTFSPFQYRAYSPALSSDGNVVFYVGTIAGDAETGRRIFAAFAKNLTTIWYTSALPASFSSHITVGAGDVLFVGADDGTVRSFFPNGSQSSTYATGVAARVSTAPSLSSSLATLFVACGGFVKAFSVSSSGGTISATKWVMSAATTFSHGAVIVSHDGATLYVTDLGYLYAVNTTSGALIAKSISGAGTFGASAAGPSCLPSVYVTTYNRFLAALDSSTTKQLWSAVTHDQCNGAPFVSLNGVVVWTNNEGVTRAVNASSGALLWSYFVGGWTKESPILGPDGTLYAIGGDGTVAALRGNTCWARAGSYCQPCSNSIAECEPGYYSSSSNASTCALCPPGSFAPATGSTSCQQCPGGHYCPSGTSSWARLYCGRGNYCPSGSGAPIPCPYQAPPTGGWGAQQGQGPAFLEETARCLGQCFWNFTSGDGLIADRTLMAGAGTRWRWLAASGVPGPALRPAPCDLLSN